MTLCAVIGFGPVGKYAAEQIRRVAPNTQFIGLPATQSWLPNIVRDAQFVSVTRLGAFRRVLRENGATEIIFAGAAYDTHARLKLSAPDRATFRYLLLGHQRYSKGKGARFPSLWFPHAYLEGIRLLLAENRIALKSPLSYLPELGVERDFAAGNCTGYDPLPDMEAAADYIQDQPWNQVRQACIVDCGKVLQAETKGTNHLISKFGASSLRKRAKFPVLCKIAVEPFELIDIPTVGIDTARLCLANGVRAMIVQSGRAIFMQQDEVAALATSHGSMCIYAV